MREKENEKERPSERERERNRGRTKERKKERRTKREKENSTQHFSGENASVKQVDRPIPPSPSSLSYHRVESNLANSLLKNYGTPPKIQFTIYTDGIA